MTSETDLFEAVEREATLTSRVTSQIEKLILDLRLQPGQRMPSERDMSLRFGVSRTVVREAVRALSAKGMLDVRPGSGTTVVKPTARTVTQSMTHFLRSGQPQWDLEKLLEIRRLLEVEISGLAAQRRTDEDLQALLEQLDALANLGDDQDGFVRCDIGFHNTLAQATHNELFALLLDSLNELMIESRRLALKLPKTRARVYRYHKAIYEQVKSGNAEGARQAMRDHMVEAAETARKALAIAPDGSKTNLKPKARIAGVTSNGKS